MMAHQVQRLLLLRWVANKRYQRRNRGELITDGHGWKDDRTVEQNAFELPDDILLPRLATIIRTIRSVSSMFDQIAWRNVNNVSWEITEEPAKW